MQAKRVAVAFPGVALATAGGLWTQIKKVADAPLPHFTDIDPSGIYGTSQQDGEPLRVCALGDSTLTGPGLMSPRSIWLPQVLDRLALSTRLDSFARGGSRIADVLAEQLEPARARRPDVFVVSIGANDATHGTRVSEFSKNLRQLMDELTHHAPVALVGVPNVGNTPRMPTLLKKPISHACSRIDRASRAVSATSNHVFRVPPARRRIGLPAAQWKELFVGDLFHPSEHGHTLWADAFEPHLRRVIRETRVTRSV